MNVPPLCAVAELLVLGDDELRAAARQRQGHGGQRRRPTHSSGWRRMRRA